MEGGILCAYQILLVEWGDAWKVQRGRDALQSAFELPALLVRLSLWEMSLPFSPSPPNHLCLSSLNLLPLSQKLGRNRLRGELWSSLSSVTFSLAWGG